MTSPLGQEIDRLKAEREVFLEALKLFGQRPAPKIALIEFADKHGLRGLKGRSTHTMIPRISRDIIDKYSPTGR